MGKLEVVSQNGHSWTSGVIPMAIEGRMRHVLERTKGMTEDERNWRRQWIKDQYLSPREPVHVPELERELQNPIKRILRKPFDVLLKDPLTARFGATTTASIRSGMKTVLVSISLIYLGAYYFKYNSGSWESQGGWRKYYTRQPVYPGSPGYPMVTNKSPNDYYDIGFKSRKVLLD